MIKILLNCGLAEWEKGNKRYKCYRKYKGEITIYSLYVWNTTTYKTDPRIISESLADINEWIKKIKVEIAED